MSSNETDSEEDLGEGTLLSHLKELRNRMIKAFGAVLVVFICLAPFSRKLLAYATGPITRIVGDVSVQAISPISPLISGLKLSFLAALLIALPVVLYQTWAFVAPGLYKKEKRFAMPMLASSILLFYAGAAFAFFVIFPLMFTFVSGYADGILNYQPDIASYISFITMIVLAFGIAFEVPIATVLLVWVGIVKRERLAKARPYVFLGAFIIGMLLTPPDFFSQTLLAVPVYLLFEIGLFMSRFFAPEAKDEPEAGLETDNA